MKSRIFAVVSAAVLMLSCCAACGDKKESSSGEGSTVSDKKKDGPVFSIDNVEAKAGETVEVSVSLSGAAGKWGMCGVHVTYDDRLECIATADDPMVPDYTQGEAVSEMMAFVTMIWLENKDQILLDEKNGCIFFTTMGENNCGKDGVIATYKFKVPEDAPVGEVYELGFYYREGDLFVNSANDDPSLQEKAFSNWESGSITVI